MTGIEIMPFRKELKELRLLGLGGNYQRKHRCPQTAEGLSVLGERVRLAGYSHQRQNSEGRVQVIGRSDKLQNSQSLLKVE